MKNIIVTGATSFIGVHIIEKYLKNNYNVIAIIRPNSKNINRLPKSNLLTIVELEMKEIEELAYKINVENVDVFYHLAWEGARIPHRDNAMLQNENYQYAIKAMETAQKLGCSVFIGTGSQAEYGRCVGKIDEEYETNPITEYGKAKLKAYRALKVMAEKSDIKFIWTRIFSVYGVYDYEGTLVMSALNMMKKDENIKLTECIQSWDFINVEDVASAMYLLANTSCEDGIYNIASGESKRLKDFVLDMKEICNSKSELQFGAIPYNSEGVISFEPIVDKLKQNLAWSCKVSFKEGIERILEFMV